VKADRRIREQLGAWLDGELPAGQAEEISRALERDPALAEQLRRLRQLERSLQELAPIEPAADFEARFRARLARQRAGAVASWRERARERLRTAPARWALGGVTLAGAALALLLAQRAPLRTERDGDWSIVADAERYELLQDQDLELLEVLEVLEAWDGSQEG
jgi:anti-sigma factor RsiW